MGAAKSGFTMGVKSLEPFENNSNTAFTTINSVPGRTDQTLENSR